MEFATGALGTLLPKLGQLLQDEYNLQKGVKKDIEFVTRELDSMRAALSDVGEVPQEQLNNTVKMWARDVRELSYDMEDIVDTFLVRVQGSEPPSKRSVKRFIKKIASIVSKAKTHHEIGQEIKDMKERVKEVTERRDRYKVDAITPTKTSVDPRITALYTKAASLVGIDGPREELISQLTREDGRRSSAEQRIVSIVGFGGLGKTTLAKAVYDKLKPQFNCTAFVSVSRDPDIMKVLKDILYELDKNEYKDIHNTALGQQHLTDLVHEFLENKRYLIVIDDIWDTEPWEIIRCALPENVLKSRIITTTRIIDVAEHVGGCYKLKPLTHHNSKMLFYGRIFGSESDCPKQFSDVSQKILKKCGGVPLAILTTSSLLANKSRNIKVWYDVCESVGKGLANNPSIDGMRKILLLSYYDLTPTLKTCLLYLSIFPEDYAIWWDRLILRWIAEGFVQQGDGRQSLYEIGQSYFNELLNRSLIQPADMDEDEMNPVYCRVHDMVLDLICSLSREENFSTTISGDCMQMTSSENKARRLSIHNTSWPTINMSKLRSLTISSYALINTMPPLSCFNLLRVLDLEDCNLLHHPSLEFVGILFHLRYLSLADTGYAGELPREIGKLQFLQTFDFTGTGIKEVPLSIFGLRQLMSLEVGDSSRLPTTSGLRNLSSLELLRMNVDSAYVAEELGHLTQLRVLCVTLRKDLEGRWEESICRVLVGSLGKLHKIKTLGPCLDYPKIPSFFTLSPSHQFLATCMEH
ncbi:disease resistance protein RGA5-like [Miscanthus floridulus]|uniref:disease resistance protein RGA5-like n=1 Tax=Miscanthus floridulus TaxID=154761 RepID=UPI00345A6314